MATRDDSGANKRTRSAAPDGLTAPPIDGLTALPIDVRGRIVSFLPYREAVRLSTLSRSWRGIRNHVLDVTVDLRDFLAADEEGDPAGVLNDDALDGLRVSLLRDPAGVLNDEREKSRVENLRLSFNVLDARMKRHVDRIVALANAKNIELKVPVGGAADGDEPSALEVDLPPRATKLGIFSHEMLAVTIAGPGSAALRRLYLDTCVLFEWPRLPTLRKLTLRFVRVIGPFAPSEHCPLLEELVVWDSMLEHAARVDIHLPALKKLVLSDVGIYPPDFIDGPCGDITIDAPSLEDLEVNCEDLGRISEYRSFTLRAPRLWLFSWFGQFAERVDIDVGRPGCVFDGTIEFKSTGEREKMIFRVMMMRMLQGLLSHLTPERVAVVAEPFITVENSTMEEEGTGVMIPLESLACDLYALTSSLDI